MRYIEGDLLRRGLVANDVPVKQVLSYLENYKDYLNMENPFIEVE